MAYCSIGTYRSRVDGPCCGHHIRRRRRNTPYATRHRPPCQPLIPLAGAGGSGTVGSGIVRQLLLEGATVIAPLRRPDQVDQLKAECSGGPRSPCTMLAVYLSLPCCAAQPSPCTGLACSTGVSAFLPAAGASLDNLLPVVVGISCEDYCQQFVGGCVQRYGRIDHAVACFGGFWEGGEGPAALEALAALPCAPWVRQKWRFVAAQAASAPTV